MASAKAIVFLPAGIDAVLQLTSLSRMASRGDGQNGADLNPIAMLIAAITDTFAIRAAGMPPACAARQTRR